jgi:hypothetical protein
MIDLIKVCGISGILSLVTTFVLLVVGVIFIGQSKSRRAFVIFGLVALLPLFIGILGTVAGYSQAARAQKLVASAGQAVLQSDREHARYTTYLGSGCTAMLWVIVCAAAYLKKRNAEQDGGGQPATGA